jgi:thioredoxin 1
MSDAVRALTETSFEEEVRSSDRPVVVEFWAEWCPPCKVMAPILDSLALDHGDRLRIFKVDSDAQTELARRYEVMSVPTILIFHKGVLQRRMVGARSRVRMEEELSGVLTG